MSVRSILEASVDLNSRGVIQPNTGRLLTAPVRITVTTSSATLAALLAAAGGSLHADLAVLSLIPAAGGVRWNLGDAAAAAGPEWPASGARIGIDAADAAKLRFIAGSSTAMDVIQEG